MAGRPNNRPNRPGGNKGNGNKGNGNKGGGNRSQTIRRSQQMVHTQNLPYLRQLARDEARARDLTEELRAQSEGIYGALGGELRQQEGYYENQYPKIAQGLTENLQGLPGMGEVSPSSELAAANVAMGSIGAGGQTLLASDRSRNLGYGASTQRQASIEKGVVGQNYLEQLADALSEIRDERTGVIRDEKTEAADLAWQLKQAQFERQMAMRDFQLRKAAAQAQIGNDSALLALTRRRINDALNDRGNRPNRPNRGNNNKPNPEPVHPGRRI
jgi:hypothetical protein